MNQPTKNKPNGGVLRTKIKELENENKELESKVVELEKGDPNDREIALEGEKFNINFPALCEHFNNLARSGRRAHVAIGARATHSEFAKCIGLDPANPDDVEKARQLILKYGA